MARNDEWCMFCEQKIKSTEIFIKGIRYEVCEQCKNLTPNTLENDKKEF